MIKKTTLWTVLFLMASSLAFADKIYLKNSKNYEGKLIGRSDRRYLFSVNISGEIFEMSFFPEDVEKIELDKESMEKQTPYLKEVETFKVPVKEDQEDNKSKVYQLSLFKEGEGALGTPAVTEKEIKSFLNKEEAQYYQRFNDILARYVDKLAAVQNTFQNLTAATKDDFSAAMQYMDELYFELNNITVPEAFKKSHTLYLESIKANFLTFRALGQGLLDEAAKQMKIAEEDKQNATSEFREIIVSRKSSGPMDSEKNTTTASPNSNEAANSQ